MQRPHASDDGRAVALAAIDTGRPGADVAAFYQNAPSTIRRWVRQRERTGSWRPCNLATAQEAALIAQVSTRPDATLAEHCAQWHATTGTAVSVSTMGR